MKRLLNKFIIETNMDDVEIEVFNDHYYVCNDVRQLGEIKRINNEYFICVQDKFLKGKFFSSNGWSF
jgi:CTP:phosphocholine cytidylyltransferase-like protein